MIKARVIDLLRAVAALDPSSITGGRLQPLQKEAQDILAEMSKLSYSALAAYLEAESAAQWASVYANKTATKPVRQVTNSEHSAEDQYSTSGCFTDDQWARSLGDDGKW